MCLNSEANHQRDTTLIESANQKWLTGPFENCLIHGKSSFFPEERGAVFFFPPPFPFNKSEKVEAVGDVVSQNQFIMAEKYLLCGGSERKGGPQYDLTRSMYEKTTSNTFRLI